MKIHNSKFIIHHLLSPIHLSCLTAIFLVFFTACSTTRPPVVAHYTRASTDPKVESCSLVAMSDQEARKQRAGTSKTRKTASGQVISKNGQIKKQTSVEEVVIEKLRASDKIHAVNKREFDSKGVTILDLETRLNSEELTKCLTDASNTEYLVDYATETVIFLIKDETPQWKKQWNSILSRFGW